MLKRKNKRKNVNIDEYKKNASYTQPFQEAKQYKKEYILEEKNSNKINRKKKGKNESKKKKIFKITIISLLVLFIIGVIAVAFIILDALSEGEKLSKDDFKISSLNSTIYNKDGTEIAVINNGTNRMVVSLNEMPEMLPKAFIAIEDERFYKHNGVDFKRSIGAIVTYIIKGKSSFGGSTITQQLVKNVTGDKEDTPKRKIREMVRALQVGNWLSKEEVLELYLNIIYLGQGTHGVQTAAYNYFGKDVSELTIAECAIIAGMTQSPEYYNPYKFPERIKKRQETVLWKMKELGYISEEQYNEAINQELVYKKGELFTDSVQSYFVESAINQVVEDLQTEKGISEAMAKKMVYSDGLKIYTTLDSNIQKEMDEVYENTKNFSTKKIKNSETGETETVPAQSAMVIMDYHNGNVVALVGGSGKKTINLGLNRAYSKRQPGSCIKPIAVYAPGIENKVITAGSVFNDAPTKRGDWNISEWYSGWKGYVTTRDAIAQSMNVPAVLALEKLGIENSYNYLQKFGITSLVAKDKNLSSLALGGLTEGVSVLEMTAAYGAIANNGTYIEPRLYTKVEDQNGRTVLEKKSKTTSVISEQTSYIMKDLLKAPVQTGTATYAKISGMDVAAKTGTTSDSKDRYFAGFTPYYVAAVWYGYDQPQRITDSGTNPAGKLWIAVMKKAHANLKAATFEKPDGLLKVTICKDTGLLPTDGCPTTTEYFLPGTQPKETCNINTKVNICKDSGLLFGTYCPESSKEEKIYRDRSSAFGNTEENEKAPTEYCNVHTKPVEPEPIPEPEESVIPTNTIHTSNTTNVINTTNTTSITNTTNNPNVTNTTNTIHTTNTINTTNTTSTNNIVNSTNTINTTNIINTTP